MITALCRNEPTVQATGWFYKSVVLRGFFKFSPYEKQETRMNFAWTTRVSRADFNASRGDFPREGRDLSRKSRGNLLLLPG